MRELEFKAVLLSFEFEFEGMKIANYERLNQNKSPAYSEKQFEDLIDRLHRRLEDVRMLK